MINFTYDGKSYSTPDEASEARAILLPDGRYIASSGWYESLPPQPMALREVEPVKGFVLAFEN